MARYRKKEIAEFIKVANQDLGSGKYSGDEMIPDYCKSIIICKQLLVDIEELEKILDRAANEDKGGCYKIIQKWDTANPKMTKKCSCEAIMAGECICGAWD